MVALTGADASQAVADRLAAFPMPHAAALQRTWKAMLKALPGAQPAISYGLPTLQVDGISVVAMDGFKRHNSLFPYSGNVIASLASELADLEQTKGSIHFPMDRPFPVQVLRRIIRMRIEEINASFPNRAGQVRSFYDNGFLKYRGRMNNGDMHGDWAWFRRDGTLMRSGTFRKGTQVGQWTTYDRTGGPVRVTEMSG
ncbi:MAG: DUF1801 domain-containing protein [Actinomycetales bacterium]